MDYKASFIKLMNDNFGFSEDVAVKFFDKKMSEYLEKPFGFLGNIINYFEENDKSFNSEESIDNYLKNKYGEDKIQVFNELFINSEVVEELSWDELKQKFNMSIEDI